MKRFDRINDWKMFSEQMERHIMEYTIPQYQNEDAKTDQVGAWDSATCVENIRRYVNRAGKNLRGSKEALRDMLKVAHYAQFAYEKLKAELDEPDVYEAPGLGSILGEK